MLIDFFDVHGIVHAEFLPQGQTVLRSCVYKMIATTNVYNQSARQQKHLAASDVLSEGEKKRTVGNEVMAALS